MDSKVMTSFNDDNYVSSEEEDDTRQGGQKTFHLLPKVAVPCRRKSDLNKKIARCIGSAGCGKEYRWPRDKTRVLGHVISCGFVTMSEGGAQHLADALQEQAKKRPEVLDEVRSKLEASGKGGKGKPRKRKGSVLEANDKPQLKRQKILAGPSLSHGRPTLSSQTQQSVPCSPPPAANPMANFKTEGRKVVEKEGNTALIELIVCCGISPNVLSHRKWADFLAAIKTKFVSPKRSRFEESLLPGYAATIRLAMIEHLAKLRNLNLTFDGGKLKRKKFFSIHVSHEGKSFCLELDSVARLSQTGEYIEELQLKVRYPTSIVFNAISVSCLKWLNRIGPYQFCSIASDDAGNTKKGRRLVHTQYPHLIDLPDACHNLHNLCKDICNLPFFKGVSALL